jgi:hypothetical protein
MDACKKFDELDTKILNLMDKIEVKHKITTIFLKHLIWNKSIGFNTEIVDFVLYTQKSGTNIIACEKEK